MFYRLAIIFILLTSTGKGQSIQELKGSISSIDILSLSGIQKSDSLKTVQEQKLDSIQNFAANQYYELKNSYDSIVSKTDAQINELNLKVDSLRNLTLPTEKFTSRIDSIQQWKNEEINRITSKFEKLKADINQKINNLELPPQLHEKASEFTSLMDKLDVSIPNTNLSLSFHNRFDLDIPSLSNPLNVQSMPYGSGLNIPSTDLGSLGNVGDEITQNQGQISQVPTNLREAGKLAEEQAKNISAVGDIEKELGQVGEITGMAGTLKDQDAMKQELIQQAQQLAVNHFDGKEAQLQEAMKTLSKYKKKYGSLTSLSDIPKRRPNEMREKPLIERLMPGIALQIFRKDDWMVDFNPYVGYRFNTRLTVGAGWNQRVGYNPDNNQFNPDRRVYGPRSYCEFKIGEGFSAHLQIEYMNTFVPPKFSSHNVDEQGREWVFSTMAGIKKEYRFFKNVKGTFYLLYNLYDPHHRSPYTDRLNMRIGFEFPMKKKPKKQ